MDHSHTGIFLLDYSINWKCLNLICKMVFVVNGTRGLSVKDIIHQSKTFYENWDFITLGEEISLSWRTDMQVAIKEKMMKRKRRINVMGLIAQPFEIHRHSLFVTSQTKVLFANHISEGGKMSVPYTWVTYPPLHLLFG